MDSKMYSVKIELECRVCLDQTKSSLTSIFETEVLEGYERCSSLKVHDDDPYPKYLCSACCSLIRSFNEFRQRCMDSQIKCFSINQATQELKNPPTESTSRTLSKHEYQYDEKPNQADFDDPDPLRSIPIIKSNLTKLFVNNDSAADVTTLQSIPIDREPTQADYDVDSDNADNGSTLESMHTDKVTNLSIADFKVESDMNASKVMPTVFSEETCQLVHSKSRTKKNKHIKRRKKNETKHNERVETDLNEADSDIIVEKQKTHRKKRRNRKLKMIGGQCDICQKRFLYRNALINHLRRCTIVKDMENGMSELCGICEETFQSTNELNEHLAFHQSANTMECKICAYKAIDFADLFTHRFSHQQLEFKSRMYCFLCLRFYRKISSMEYHFRGVHMNKEKPGVCKTCKKEFKCYKHYVEHMRTHTGKLLTCDQCPKQFKYDGLLYRHKQTHCDEKKYMCHLCGFSSKRASGLRSHTFHRHKNHEPIICNHCGKTFKNPQSHRAHMLRAKGGSVLCPVCSKSYRSEKEMLNHFKWHTNNKPYVCDICGSAYKAKCHLKVHTRVHTGETPYACGICDMRFVTTNSFNRHVLIHSGEKPYICSICEKKFTMKSNLKKHIARHGTPKKVEQAKL